MLPLEEIEDIEHYCRIEQTINGRLVAVIVVELEEDNWSACQPGVSPELLLMRPRTSFSAPSTNYVIAPQHHKRPSYLLH